MRNRHEFGRVLIANRGEIAVRIARTLREMGITPIAVYSEPDRTAPHVRACELACFIGAGPASESYLSIEKIVDAAKRSRADAIHPGYGFLSENVEFAEAVAAAGITFIGPSPSAIRVMGSKTLARAQAIRAGVAVVPGSDEPVGSLDAALEEARRIGYPIFVKAVAGGGGKGLRLVASEQDLPSAFRSAKSEAKSSFGDDAVYFERALPQPKHLEVQIFADALGTVIPLGERDCSMQRRHQKLIEETPSAVLTDATR